MTRTGYPRYAAELLSLLACVLLVVVVAVASWFSYRAHSESERELALRRAENMALVLRALASDTLRSVDDAVRGLKGAVERSGMNIDLTKIVDDRRAIANYIAVMSVADAEGRLVRSTLPIPEGAKITDLAHFQAHVGHDGGEPFINRPLLGRVSGKWSFHVTRRINRPGGAFGGVAIVAVDLSYWERLLRDSHLGYSGAVVLVGLDGFARAVFSPGAGEQGDMMKAEFGFLARKAAADGETGGRVSVAGNGGGLDGTWVYRRVEGFPLLVAVAADDRMTLARLQAMSDRYVGGTLAIILLIVLFTMALLVFFSRQRQHAAERARMAESWRQSEERFRSVFEHAGIGITLRNAMDRYQPWLAVNDRFCEMTGYSREELLRMNAGQITLPEENAVVDVNNARLVRGEISSIVREKRIIRKDGSLYWVALVITGLPDAAGRPYRVIATYQDINARKVAEELARDSDERFKAVFDHAGVGMSLRPARDRLLPWTAVNDKFCEMTGYSRAELLRLSTADLTPPEGHDEALHDNQRLMRGEVASYAREKRLLCKDDRLLWVNLSVASLPGPDGKPLQIVSTYQDITARKQVEELLRKSEQQFKAIFDHAGIGITLRPAGDRNQPLLAVNDKFCEMTGYSREEALRLGTIDISAQERIEGAIRDRQRLMSGETRSYSLEKRIRRKDGSWIWIALSVAALPDAQGRADMVIATYQDINARRLVEERLRAIIAAEPECVAIVSPDGMLIDMNPAGLRMLEAGSLEEMRNRPFLKQVVPQFRRAFVRLQRRILAGESGMLEFEAEGLAGNRRWLEIHGAPLHDASGGITALLGIARDVTDRRMAREALAAERNLLRTVIDSMPDRIRVKDQDLRFILANKAWMALRAPWIADIRGRNNYDFLAKEEADRLEDEDRAVLETGSPSRPREVSHATPDGPRWYITTKIPLRGTGGAIIGVIAISRDVTDLKLRSIEVEKLNAVLEARVAERTLQLTTANEELEAFASSVSHDLRAPLRQIDGFAAALYEDYADRLDATGGGYLSRIRAGVSRMGALIEDLLRLSRVTRAELRLTKVDLSGLVAGIAGELQREQPQRRVSFHIQAGLRAEADPGLLHAALANLLSNAWKFTGNNPEAVIEFGASERDGVTVYFVRDNGAGFDMSRVNRLFGTFQRLHAESEFSGTGIGLAIVRRVVRRHGGEAWAESVVGDGATFYFTLGPQMSERVRSAEPVAHKLLAAEPAPGTAAPVLLLVDDDPDVMVLAERVLRREGYQLLKASSAEAALGLLHGRRVAAVISDFSMPGKNGAELLSEVARIQPATLRIIVSGQNLNPEMEAGLQKGEIHRCFRKQSDFGPLLACIREGLAVRGYDPAG